MTHEQNDLLLKDLCARLPYGVKFESEYAERVYFIDTSDDEIYINGTNIENCKPYLFPLSSMTEEQRKEYDSIIYHNVELHADRYYEVIDVDSFELLHDFYHKNHFDYRGLIPLDLAIDCTNLNIY